MLLVGPVRQEFLSGGRDPTQFRTLRDRRRAFPDVSLDSRDHEEAAVCFNRCRAKGVQGSNTDFLLCAIALRRGAALLTTDKDFDRFARILPNTRHGLRPNRSA